MNAREMHREWFRLVAERGWEETGVPSTYLLHLMSAREDARNSLLHHVHLLRNDLDRLDKLLRADYSPILNTLGELQQRPAAVEAAVGEFAAADKALRTFLEMFPVSTEAPRS